jgi:hypothetical protein
MSYSRSFLVEDLTAVFCRKFGCSWQQRNLSFDLHYITTPEFYSKTVLGLCEIH